MCESQGVGGAEDSVDFGAGFAEGLGVAEEVVEGEGEEAGTGGCADC